MAKQSKDVFSITPISLATEAAVQEAAEAAAAAQSSTVSEQPKEQPTAQPSSKQGRRGSASEPVIKSDSKEQRINRTFTITATNDRNLGMAAVHYGVSKSAILEQLFEQFWNAHEKEIRN